MIALLFLLCLYKFLPTHQAVPLAVLFVFMYALMIFTGISCIRLSEDAYPIRLGATHMDSKK